MTKSRMIKMLVSTAMVATSLSPLASTIAMADTIPAVTAAALSAANEAAMEDQCSTLAATYDTGNGDIWEGTVVLGAVTQTAGPTEVAGSRDIDESTIVGTGTLVPSSTEIRFGDKNGPFRIGGSVNLFGDQWATAGFYPDSTYSYDADFDSTFSHAYSCQITQAVYHAGYTEHVPAEGAYVVNGDFGGSEDAVRGNCLAYTNQGFPLETRPAWWGVEIYRGGNTDPDSNGYRPHCRFEGTPAEDIDHPESWDPAAIIANLPQSALLQDQTDSLTAFEDHGGRVNVTGEYKIGQAVVCISPTTSTTVKKGVPGAWRPQNGYSGGNMLETLPATAGCNTKWFSVAQWGSGSTTSNGTYISVPFYSY